MRADHRPLFLLLALFAVSLSACPRPPRPQGAQPGAATGGTKPAEQMPSEYRFPLPDDPMTLDPAHITDTVSDSVARRIFSQLVRFAPDSTVIADLAEKWEISPDGRVYTFHLRQSVRFHDGTLLTAQDVVYTFSRLADRTTKAERVNLLYYIAGANAFHEGKSPDFPGVQAVDDHTVRITLSAPYAPFLHVLCMTTFGVVPKGEVDRDPAGFGDHPVGSGPYVFDSWLKDDRVVLKANRDYFKEPPPLQTVIFRVIKDEKTRFENFKSGALEHCDLPPSQIQEVRRDPRLDALVHGEPAMDMYAYGFNCEQPPFKDNTALRRALNFAVDKDNICKNIWGGLVTTQKTYVPEGMFYFWKDAPGYPYDPEKAKQLLDEAGYPGGAGLPELVLNIDLQPTNRLVAQAVQEDLRRVGVKVRIETTAWGPFLEKVYGGEVLFFQNTWLADYPDPDNWLYQLLHSSNFGDRGNIARWRNSEFDQLVTEAQVSLDTTHRAELYRRAEDIAYKEAPWLLLFWKNSSTLVQPYVQGLVITRMDRTPQLNNAPLEQVHFEAQ
jgi:peptide/nickel transport system substrate-binding protein/oligopeptide transport system substrate-binding protein